MSGPIRLSLAAVDVLYELLGCCGPGDRPYPFDVPHHGRTTAERADIRAAVLADLTGRRLVSDGEPEPDLADALVLLGRSERTIAAVGMLDAARPPLRARAAAGHGRCVLGVLDDHGLRLDDVRPSTMAAAVVALVPDTVRGPGHSVTTAAEHPAAAERPAAAAPGGYLAKANRRGPTSPGTTALDAILRRPRTRIGQFSVVDATGRTTRVFWFDTDVGRYLTYTSVGHDGAAWTVHSPADNTRLAAILADLLDAGEDRRR